MAGKKRKRSPIGSYKCKEKLTDFKESSTPKKKKLSLTKHIKPPALEFAASPVIPNDRADTITATNFDTPSGSVKRKIGNKNVIVTMPALRKPSNDMDATLSNFSGQTDYRSYGSKHNAHNNAVDDDRPPEDILDQATVSVQEPDQGVRIWLQEALAEQKRGIDARLETINDNLIRLSNTVTQIHDAVLIGLGLDEKIVDEANKQETPTTSDSEGENENEGDEPIVAQQEPPNEAGNGDDDGDLMIETSAEASNSNTTTNSVEVEQVHVVNSNTNNEKEVEIVFID